jgi:HEAT repeat protein
MTTPTLKQLVAGLFAALLIVAFGLIALSKPKLYQRKTVSQWVALLDTQVDNQKQREDASSALVQIGAAALPHLERILAWRPDIWETVRNYGVRCHFVKPREVNPLELQSRACEAAYKLAERAQVDISRLVPQLQYHFTNGTYADLSSGRALANAGPAGISALTNFLSTGGRSVRDNAGSALRHAISRPEVIEALIRSANSEPDPMLGANALLYLSGSGAEAQQVVPLGLTFLKSDDGYRRWAAASLLLRYRAVPEAQAALVSAISDPDQRVRSVSERALKEPAASEPNRK